MFDEGKLTPEQAAFWRPRPSEELYDLENDPDEVHNLADSPDHRAILLRMRKVQRDFALETRDVGFLPEDEIHSRSKGSSPYAIGHDEAKYPLKRILGVAELASSLDPEAVPALKKALADGDSAVRYWAALGLLMRGRRGVAAGREALRHALKDDAPCARIAAAWALGKFGDPSDLDRALPVLLDLASFERSGLYVSLLSLTALDDLDEKAAGAVDRIRALPTKIPPRDRRCGYGIPPLVEKTLADLEKE